MTAQWRPLGMGSGECPQWITRPIAAGRPSQIVPPSQVISCVLCPTGWSTDPEWIGCFLFSPLQGGVPERGSASEGEGGASRAVYPDGDHGSGVVVI